VTHETSFSLAVTAMYHMATSAYALNGVLSGPQLDARESRGKEQRVLAVFPNLDLRIHTGAKPLRAGIKHCSIRRGCFHDTSISTRTWRARSAASLHWSSIRNITCLEGRKWHGLFVKWFDVVIVNGKKEVSWKIFTLDK
jgi:hypothetical protein